MPIAPFWSAVGLQPGQEALGGSYDVTLTNNGILHLSAGDNFIAALNSNSLQIDGGGNTVKMLNGNALAIAGGGNTVVMLNNNNLLISDMRTIATGFAGTIAFGDTITAANNNSIELDYGLVLGKSDTVTVNFAPSITDGRNTILLNDTVIASNSDVITFADSGEAVTLSVGRSDMIATTGSNDTITIGGDASSESSMRVGTTGAGTTINGGLGSDTFTAGSGYIGGVAYIGSVRGFEDGFDAIGNCVNYSSFSCRVTVDDNSGLGQGFDASGNLLWTDTYSNIQQIKAGQLDGNILTGSNAYYCELKGSIGQTTYYGGAAGDRIVWSSAGAGGQLDGRATDIAYGGSGPDEFYWRNSPGGKGVSNFGETIFGFNPGQGDDLNFSEFADSGFAAVTTAFTFANLADWVDVSLSADGQDTDFWFDRTGGGNFTQLAAVLKNENLFSAYSVADYSNAGAQQVVHDMYASGALVLTMPH